MKKRGSSSQRYSLVTVVVFSHLFFTHRVVGWQALRPVERKLVNYGGTISLLKHHSKSTRKNSRVSAMIDERAWEKKNGNHALPRNGSIESKLLSDHHHPRIINGPHNEEALLLQEENLRLREALHQLEVENKRLHQQFDNRVILEMFEGESKIKRFSKAVAAGEDLPYEDEFGLPEECLIEDLEEGACPIEPTVSFGEAFRDRAYWLVGLLILQSCSGIILANNQALLTNHPVIIYFLTMLVGAGGNAGNQASVRVIRGLALGTLNQSTQVQFLARELKMAAALSCILTLAGFVRAAVFRTPLIETVTVATALALIVFTSVCLGAVLPLLLKKIGVDPAHSSTSIQVIMDILGVLLAVTVSSVLLESPLGALIISRLSF